MQIKLARTVEGEEFPRFAEEMKGKFEGISIDDSTAFGPPKSEWKVETVLSFKKIC